MEEKNSHRKNFTLKVQGDNIGRKIRMADERDDPENKLKYVSQ